jgi:hypothetical protein
MPLMSNPAGGEGGFTTYVKYNAKAGRFYTKKDEKDAPEFEVTNFTAIMDLESVKTGWFLFAAGVAPAKTYDPSLSQAAARPGDGFKRGFEVLCFSEKNLLGVREFSSTAGVVIEAINAVYDAWEAGRAANAGKVPVIKCVGVHPVTNKHGTNYAPQFEIVSWADRPADLPAGAAPTAAASAPSPAAAAVQHVGPPTAATAPEPAMAGAGDDVEF